MSRLLLLGAGGGGGGGGSPLLTNLVEAWHFDEASGTALGAYAGKDLTDNNTVTSAAGLLGTARYFDSANSEYFSRPDEAAFDLLTQFGFMGWVWPDALATSQTIAGKWLYNTQGGWTLQTHNTTLGDLLAFFADSLTDAGGNSAYTTDTPLTAGAWNHIALSYDGGGAANADRAKLWVNAVQRTLSFAGTIPASLPNNTADLIFGHWPGLGRYWKGRQDEPGIWSAPLTQTLVDLHYNSGTGRAYPYT